MEDQELKIVGGLRVHAVYSKTMGSQKYRMASLDLVNEEGEVVDTVSVFCNSDHPSRVRFSNYKGQLSIKVE
jgi:hypothetical protein